MTPQPAKGLVAAFALQLVQLASSGLYTDKVWQPL